MSDTLRVAFDVGPLHGHRTGIGAAIAEIRYGFSRRADDERISLVPYVLSTLARLGPGERRLPLPAAAAHALWSHADGPRVDRWLGDVDLVHGTNYVVPPSRSPTLVSVYDCWFLRHPQLASRPVARAGAVLRRRVAAGAHVHTSSQATADVVRAVLDSDRVTAVHLGPLAVPPPPGRAPISALPAGPFVVTIGTRERRKNLPRLVEAYGTLAAERGDVALVIAGAPGDDDEATLAAIEHVPATARRRLWLLGGVNAATRSWLLHHATAIAYPSLDEGFGFPVLEAQTLGVPIVGGRAGSIPEIGGDGVEYVDPLDVNSIAAALLRVVVDEARRAELVTAGTSNVARFSWDRTVDQLTALYRDLAEGRR